MIKLKACTKRVEGANYALERNESKNALSLCRLNLRDFPIPSLHTYQVLFNVYFKKTHSP